MTYKKERKNKTYEVFAYSYNYLLWKKKGFDYKNNYGRGKLANFWLDNINKINYRTLVVLSYISLKLCSRII